MRQTSSRRAPQRVRVVNSEALRQNGGLTPYTSVVRKRNGFRFDVVSNKPAETPCTHGYLKCDQTAADCGCC